MEELELMIGKKFQVCARNLEETSVPLAVKNSEYNDYLDSVIDFEFLSINCAS